MSWDDEGWKTAARAYDAERKRGGARFSYNGSGPQDDAICTMRRADEIEQAQVEWIWPNRIARGKMTLLGGDPDVGKSQIALDVHARLSTGMEWPDGGNAPCFNSLILSAEDDPADTICPRLDLAGADLSKIHILEMVKESNGQKRSFNLRRDIETLARTVALSDVGLICIDPITAYMGGIDSHRTTDVRGVLEPLDRFGRESGIAILAITHPPKAAQAKAINAFTGSLAYVAAPRFAFVAISETETNRRLLLPVRNALGELPPGIGYRIEAGTTLRGMHVSRVVWDSEPVNVTASEAMHESTEANRCGISALREAKEWLREYLADGPMTQDQVEAAAKQQEISTATLRRARKALKIISVKDGWQGEWKLRLP